MSEEIPRTEVHIVGTSHIAEQSVKHIKNVFLHFKPDIVAVELDRNRLTGLMSEEKKRGPSFAQVGQLGVVGFLFAVIGGFLQRKMGRAVGMQPGVDMKQAVLLAQNNKVPVALIDRDIRVTLKRLSKQLSRKEKWTLFTDLFFGWAKKKPKNMPKSISLKNVPSDKLIEELMVPLKERYPTFYNVLVHERNVFMGKSIVHLAQKNQGKKILVVIGAGHKQGIQEYLSGKQKKTSA